MVVNDLLTMGEHIADAAASDPISAGLLAVGHVLLAFSIGSFGLLSAGALVGAARPD